ncbi:MAG: EAL domain-containing protein [Sphingomonadaceae bacterium]
MPRFRVCGSSPLRSDLETALELGQFIAVFQPFVAPRSGKVELLEATMRWMHPARGMLAPHEFLCEAYQFDLLDQIAVSLVEQASIAAKAWRNNSWTKPGTNNLAVPISVNLSGATLSTHAARTSINDCSAALGLSANDLGIAGFSAVEGIQMIDVFQCDDTRDAITEHLIRNRRSKDIGLTGVSTLLQWYLSAESDAALVQGDFICPPTPCAGLIQALDQWHSTFRIISAAT